MQLIRRGRDLILNPKVHQRTLIWLHGLGDSAEGFLPLFQMNKLFENCRIVLLTAPVRPVTLNSGTEMNSWHDISSLEKIEVNNQVLESAEIISNEIISQKNDADFIILGGFSQGGALSLYTGLAHLDTPVLLYHGRDDSMITMSMAKTSYERVLKDIKYKFMSEEGLGHGVSLKGLHEMKTWVKTLL